MHTQYIAGFFDGEGSAGLYTQRRSSTPTGWKIQPQVNISQFDPSDELIDIFVTFLDENEIPYSLQQQDSGRMNLRIQHRDGVVKLWEILGEHLVEKREELRILAEEIIPMLQDGKHLTEDGFLEVMQKKEELDLYKSSSANTNREYDLEYFEQEFGV